MSVVTTPGILLRSHAYGETSRILRFFTRDLGIVGVMARGIRRSGSKGAAVPGTFATGRLTLYVKETRGLQTLGEVSVLRARRGLGAHPLRLGAASVMGEIVLRHGGEAAAPDLFHLLDEALDRIEVVPEDELLPALLARGWSLVSTLGYHPVLELCVACGGALAADETGRFDFGAGGVRCAGCSSGVAGPRVGPGAREQLDGLVAGREGPVTRPRAHLRLLSDFVTYHLSASRPLDSFSFLAGLLPPDPAVRTTAGGPAEEDAE